MHRIKLVPCVALMYLLTFTGVSSWTVITCDDGSAVQQLDCGDRVISVKSALYGRKDRDTCSSCPAGDCENTMCSQAGTLDFLEEKCNGKSMCQISMADLHTSDPCPGTCKYLKTDYTCVHAVHLITCEGSMAQIKCGRGEVISVFAADYGRHDKTTCSCGRPESQLQDVSCCLNATNIITQECNGKNSCNVTASNTVFGDPCYGTYKYLELAYKCKRIKGSQKYDARPRSHHEALQEAA